MTAIPVRWLTVFLDFPAGSFGAGVAFWREVTATKSVCGWCSSSPTSSSPE